MNSRHSFITDSPSCRDYHSAGLTWCLIVAHNWQIVKHKLTYYAFHRSFLVGHFVSIQVFFMPTMAFLASGNTLHSTPELCRTIKSEYCPQNRRSQTLNWLILIFLFAVLVFMFTLQRRKMKLVCNLQQIWAGMASGGKNRSKRKYFKKFRKTSKRKAENDDSDPRRKEVQVRLGWVR